MLEYFHVPMMDEWRSLPGAAEAMKTGGGELSFSAFLLNGFCRRVVEGHLVVGGDLNGVDFDDFVWSIEVLASALTPSSRDRSE